MSVKWKGQSTYQMRLAMDNVRDLGFAKRTVVQQLDKGIQDAETKVKQELIRLLNLKDVEAQDITRGWSWDCPDSPTGHCVYNTTEDPFKDFCLICEQPSDRG